MARRRNQWFPLLVYTPLRRWGDLGLLATVVLGLFWLLAPRILGPTPLRPLLLLAVLASATLMLYGYFAPKVAHVRCTPEGIRLQGPLMPLVISYRRVKGTRPVQMGQIFDLQKDRAARRWPQRYWSMTAVVVELNGFPVSPFWLRLWFDPHLFLPGGSGLVLLVEDWMGLSQQMDSIVSLHRSRRRSP